jgi:hypothetical protein
MLAGTIKRRFLVNFRVDPDVLKKMLPTPFSPKLHRGHGVVGICLIRLEQVRPQFFPSVLGLASENAAHRMAVRWEEKGRMKTGVFIPRRDTNSLFNVFAGGRLFPGVQNRASFLVKENRGHYQFSMTSKDQQVSVAFSGQVADKFPADSCFSSLEESSEFFKRDHLGYSVRNTPDSYDGLSLKALNWKVKPFHVDDVTSSYFMNVAMFPKGSITFDHALIMQNIESEWLAAERLENKI